MAINLSEPTPKPPFPFSYTLGKRWLGPQASAGVVGLLSACLILLPLPASAAGGDGSEGFVIQGVHGQDFSGTSVASAGDVNGDGIDDLVVGAHDADPGGKQDVGASYVVFGRSTGFEATFDLRGLYPAFGGDGSTGFILEGIEEDDQSGTSVSGIGDVNNDGIDDLLIGSPRRSTSRGFEHGESYVVFGRATGFPAVFRLGTLTPGAGGDGTEGFLLRGVTGNDRSGEVVSFAGNINGDGIQDLMLSAEDANPGGAHTTGQTYVIFGRDTPFPAAIGLESLFPAFGGDGSSGIAITGVSQSDLSGTSIDGGGDINADGVHDLIIGARNAVGGVGEAYVVFGRTTPFPPEIKLRNLFPDVGGDGSDGFVIKAVDAGDLGEAVGHAGDVNGDGIDDLIVGDFLRDSIGEPEVGESYVLFGKDSAFAPVFELKSLYPVTGGDGSAGFVLKGIDSDDWSGRPVGSAGDINADGIDDLVIGAAQADPDGRLFAGETYIVYGRSTGFPAVFELGSLLPSQGGDGTEGFVLNGIDQFDYSGGSVSAAGDVNGDGIDDLIIGATGGDPEGRTGAGETYVVFGRTEGFPPVFELSSLLP